MVMRTENGRFLKITEIYAFVSVDDEGNEGIMGFQTSQGMMPMIGADLERVASLIEVADKIKENTGMDYEVRTFKQKVE